MDSLAKQILTLFTEDRYYTPEKKEKIKNLIEGFIDNVKKLDNESISLDTSIESLQKKTSSLSGIGVKTKQIRGHSLIKEAEEIKRCIMELANSKIRVSLKDSLILNLAVNLEQIFHKQLLNTRTAKNSFASIIGTLVLSSIIPSEEEEEETETETETEEEESASYNEKEKGPNEKDLLEENDKLKSKIRELEEDSDLEKVKKLSSNSDVKSKQKVWYYMKYKCDSLRTAIPTERYDNCDFWGLDFLEPTFDEDVKFIEDKLGHDFFVASLFCDQGSINDQGSSQSSQSSQSNLPAPQLYSGCSIASSLLKGSLGPVSQSENKYYGITSAHLSSGKNDKVFNYPEKTEVGEVHEHCKEHDFASFKIDDCYTSFDDIKSLKVFETFEELESALKGGISLIRCSKDGELVLQVGENEKNKVRLSKLEEFGTLGKEGSNLVLVIKLPLLDEFVTQNGCSGELLTMNEHFISLHKGMFPDLIDLEKRITEVKDETKKKNYEKYFQKTKQGELPISLISVPAVTIQNKLSGHQFYKIKKPTPLTK